MLCILCILGAKTLLAAKGIATRSKDATRGSWRELQFWVVFVQVHEEFEKALAALALFNCVFDT